MFQTVHHRTWANLVDISQWICLSISKWDTDVHWGTLLVVWGQYMGVWWVGGIGGLFTGQVEGVFDRQRQQQNGDASFRCAKCVMLNLIWLVIYNLYWTQWAQCGHTLWHAADTSRGHIYVKSIWRCTPIPLSTSNMAVVVVVKSAIWNTTGVLRV